MENKTDRQQSEFNDALGFLNRLNGLFHSANLASIELNSHFWFNILMALYRELSSEMKPEELKLWNTKRQEINNKLNQKYNQRIKGIPSELYNELDKFEIFLRDVYTKSGLKNRLADDAMKALR